MGHVKLKGLEVDLPIVEFEVFGSQARATGINPIIWGIYAQKINENLSEVYIEAEIDDSRSMTQIAHVSIHRNRNKSLIDEAQSVSAAILWSAIRSWNLKKYEEKRETKNKLRKLWFRSNKEG